MNIFKKFLLWLVLTNIGRMIGSFIFGVLFYALSNKTYEMGKDTLSNGFLYTALVFATVLASHVLVMFAYAWVINPIMDYCNYKGKGTKFCKIFCKKCENV
jgi:uncharacterized membrane protein YedE/YeeE